MLARVDAEVAAVPWRAWEQKRAWPTPISVVFVVSARLSPVALGGGEAESEADGHDDVAGERKAFLAAHLRDGLAGPPGEWRIILCHMMSVPAGPRAAGECRPWIPDLSHFGTWPASDARFSGPTSQRRLLHRQAHPQPRLLVLVFIGVGLRGGDEGVRALSSRDGSESGDPVLRRYIPKGHSAGRTSRLSSELSPSSSERPGSRGGPLA